ncbi:MAG: SMC-Scp complex subunit ScpB [Lachnospiraceae bacterium]|nr:SMC-Scp complex subunit ScpB [Lachnospiraceae bacterium]
MDRNKMEAAIEGILFTFGEAVDPGRIAKALEVETKEVVEVIKDMQSRLKEQERGIQITELDGSYQMCTPPELYEYLIRIAKQPRKQVLTDVLLETLSIIAYKQPITKSEIEKIRGVSCDHAVSKLVEYSLVTELGRLDAPGRPMLFGTTEEFLRSFGVSSIDELPTPAPDMVEEFKQQAEQEIKLDVGGE